MNRRGARGSEGFTLLEVLITLVILAVGVTLTLSLISGALANIRKVQLRSRTIQHAESVMELALLDDAITQPTTLQGDFADGTRWVVQVSEFDVPKTMEQLLQQQPQAELPVKLFLYSLEIMAPGSPAADLRLQTLKVVNVQQPLGFQEMPQ
jgi:prepilin-type N-terminal cleavage/methylation domain-containing protein